MPRGCAVRLSIDTGGIPGRHESLPWRPVWIAGVAISLMLVAASAFARTVLIDRCFLPDYLYVDNEANLPTWWSITVLSLGAFTALAVAAYMRSLRHGGVVSMALLGAFLLALSVDEGTVLHEWIGKRVSSPESFDLGWLAGGLPVGVAVVVAAVVAARHLPAATRTFALIGLGVFLFGAMGFELVGWLFTRAGMETADMIATHAEEFFEMAGALTMGVAPLRPVRVEAVQDGS